jgi:CheY-specific phosphatase CheX
LASEAQIETSDIRRTNGRVDEISLRDVTAVIAVGGPISFLVSFSLDRSLLDAMFAVYTSDIDIAEDEREEFACETVGEIVNLIMGQTTTDLQIAGAVLSVSPPIVFADTRQVRRPKRAIFNSAIISTPQGSLQVCVIGPPELFDPHLNVVD